MTAVADISDDAFAPLLGRGRGTGADPEPVADPSPAPSGPLTRYTVELELENVMQVPIALELLSDIGAAAVEGDHNADGSLINYEVHLPNTADAQQHAAHQVARIEAAGLGAWVTDICKES